MTIRKKILYVITKSNWGGAQKYVYDLATNLPKEQFEIVVVTGGTGPLAEKLTEAGIRVLTIPILQTSNNFSRVLFNPVNLRALFALTNIYRRERPDIIHLNSSKIGGIGAVAAFLYKIINYKLSVITVFTAHGWGFKEPRPWWEKAAIFFFAWLSSLFHDKIVLINNADFRTAQKFIPARKLALIHNGIGAINFLPREEARAFFAKKTKRPITSGTILVGTNAELTQNKGLLSFLRGLTSYCKSTRLNLVGVVIGEGEQREELEKYIRASIPKNQIYLLGFVPDAARYLKGFDIFVLPSLKEGLPYTIMEAMAAGLPIIASRVGGIPDLITHQEDGLLVPPANSELLGEELRNLISQGKGAVLGANARRKLESSFHLDNMIHKTITLYSK